MLEAARALYARQYKKAISYYSEALKLRNKFAQEKNVLAGLINGYLLAMAYAMEGSRESMKKLEQLVKKENTDRYLRFSGFVYCGLFQSPDAQDVSGTFKPVIMV